MILVQGKVDGKQVTFLLDTGSLGTIVSFKLYRNLNYPLQGIHRNWQGAGVSGESVQGCLDLEFGGHRWFSQRVSVMNLDELSDILGIEHVDGLLGEDILRQFRYVRIDYHAHIVELEE
jgi:Aspartyl protease